jgi:nicotinamidase/pyrazinamidase
MRPALVITDMLRDFILPAGPLPVGEEGIRIVPKLQSLVADCHRHSVPVIYANDALMPDDFLFRSRMKPHGIRGTMGAEVIDELRPTPVDLIVHKRRFSAFFKTDLEVSLRQWGIDTVVVAGVSTEICVLTTAYDAVCHGFEAIVLEDCCASRSRRIRDDVIDVLKRSPLQPLLMVMTFADFRAKVFPPA